MSNKESTFDWKKQSKVFLFVSILILLGILLIFIQVYFEAANSLADLQNPKVEKPHSDFVIEVIKSLSQVLLISGVMSIFAEFVLRANMLKEFTSRTSSILGDFFNKALDSSVRYGFVGITDSLDFSSLFSSTRPGDHVLWLDTYAPGHVQWLDIVEQKAESGVNFKFLVLEPGCHEAKLRSKEIGGRFEDTFDHELRIFIFDLISLAKRVKPKGSGSIEVKMYNDLLATPFYIISKQDEPDFAATSFYLRKATGVTFPHLEWRHNDGGFVVALKDYYSWKWDEAQDISDDYFNNILLHCNMNTTKNLATPSPNVQSASKKKQKTTPPSKKRTT